MLSGVGVVCFTGSFLLAFFLESARFRFGSASLRIASLAALIAGLIAETAHLYHHFILGSDRLVVSVGGWFFVLAWGLAMLTLYFALTRPKTPFTLFLIPPTLLATLAGMELAGANFPVSATARSIRAFHGFSLLAATLFLLLGFLAGVLYFLQSAKLRRKGRFLARVNLPSLEWLRRSNRRAVRLAVVFLGTGILSGFYINHALSQGGGGSLPIPLSDLMVAGAIFLFLLLVIVGAIFSCADPNRTDRRIALLTIACFLMLAAILAFGVINPKSHWRAGAPQTSSESPALSDSAELSDQADLSDEGTAP